MPNIKVMENTINMGLTPHRHRYNTSVRPFESHNIASLKSMVTYLSKLKEGGKISESQFAELITDVCANYVENEVEKRISQYLNKMVFTLI